MSEEKTQGLVVKPMLVDAFCLSVSLSLSDCISVLCVVNSNVTPKPALQEMSMPFHT